MVVVYRVQRSVSAQPSFVHITEVTTSRVHDVPDGDFGEHSIRRDGRVQLQAEANAVSLSAKAKYAYVKLTVSSGAIPFGQSFSACTEVRFCTEPPMYAQKLSGFLFCQSDQTLSTIYSPDVRMPVSTSQWVDWDTGDLRHGGRKRLALGSCVMMVSRSANDDTIWKKLTVGRESWLRDAVSGGALRALAREVAA